MDWLGSGASDKDVIRMSQYSSKQVKVMRLARAVADAQRKLDATQSLSQKVDNSSLAREP
jgi:hypothetical protein